MTEAADHQDHRQIQADSQPESEAAAQQQVLQTLDDIQQISENLVVLLTHQQEKIDTIAANIENSAATTVEGVKQVHKVRTEEMVALYLSHLLRLRSTQADGSIGPSLLSAGSSG